MSLAEDYAQQAAWRSWPTIFEALPDHLDGHTVLDLGCAVGDQAAELVARGARVLGFDANSELLAVARSKGLTDATFHAADLREPPKALPADAGPADGIWCSFAAAYFPHDLSDMLRAWAHHLRPGGWILLAEVDDLFGHEPVTQRTRELLEAFAREALAIARYDFHMGRRLTERLAAAGFTPEVSFEVDDLELAFQGPARPAVVAAWRARLERMQTLQTFCGDAYAALRDDVLGCLERADHRATATVRVARGRRDA